MNPSVCTVVILHQQSVDRPYIINHDDDQEDNYQELFTSFFGQGRRVFSTL